MAEREEVSRLAAPSARQLWRSGGWARSHTVLVVEDDVDGRSRVVQQQARRSGDGPGRVRKHPRLSRQMHGVGIKRLGKQRGAANPRRKPSPRFPVSPPRGAYTGAASSFRISTDAVGSPKGAEHGGFLSRGSRGIEEGTTWKHLRIERIRHIDGDRLTAGARHPHDARAAPEDKLGRPARSVSPCTRQN